MDSNQTSLYLQQEQWISDYIRHHSELVCEVYLIPIIGFLGIVSNGMNLHVFIRQGLRDNTNLKFAALSLMDLLSGVVSLVFAWCRILGTYETRVFSVSKAFTHSVIGWQRIPLTRAAACITLLITVERCLCIILPLKVKLIFTRRLVVSVFCFIFVLFLLLLIPVYFPIYVIWTEVNNVSMLDVAVSPNAQDYFDISFQTSSIVLLMSYSMMFLSTLFLIRGLLIQSSKRKSMLSTKSESDDSSSKQANQSSRDVKVMKLVVLVALMFVCCSVPELVMTVLTIVHPQVAGVGEQGNTFYTGWAIAGVGMCVNSSSNILVYIKMSSSYRKTLYAMFGKEHLINN